MKWKYLIFIFVVFLTVTQATAQLTDTEKKQLEIRQDSLEIWSYKMINGLGQNARLRAVKQFIPAFVDALKIKNSFYFPFDSMDEISILYDEEHTFRIFTWAIATSEFHYRFYGVIQEKTEDGHLKLIPLFDNSFFTDNTDTITGPKGWLGALYYNLIEKKFKNKTYYTLIGWAGKNYKTDKKVLDVLTFQNGKAVFGAPIFYFPKDNKKLNRFYLEYKKNGNAGLNYDTSRHLIIYDHLVSVNGHPKDTASFVPDGTYSGFKWVNGHWKHVDRVFNQEQNSEKAPVPHPVNFNKKIEGILNTGS